MLKITLSIVILISSNIFAFSGGNGAGNGGHGYICETGYVGGKKVTLLLDIAENLKEHYSKDYFKNYQRTNSIISSYIGIIDSYEVSNAYQLGLERFLLDLKSLFSNEINLNLAMLKTKFSPQELKRAGYIKSRIVNETHYLAPTAVAYLPNTTKDKGKTKNLEDDFKAFHLYNCKDQQIAILQNFVYDSSSDKKYTLILDPRALQFIDDKSLMALLWHEILYLSVKDEDSNRIRSIVSGIIKSLY